MRKEFLTFNCVEHLLVEGRKVSSLLAVNQAMSVCVNSPKYNGRNDIIKTMSLSFIKSAKGRL